MFINYANEIKHLLTMEEVARFYGFEISRAGFINCPFHAGDHTASLKIYPKDKGFHCFGCGASGDVIDFVMKLFNLSFMDAVRKIDYDFSLNLDIGKKPSLRQIRETQRAKAKRDEEKEYHEKLKNDYTKALDEWCVYDRMLREKAADSEEYSEAAKKIDEALYLL